MPLEISTAPPAMAAFLWEERCLRSRLKLSAQGSAIGQARYEVEQQYDVTRVAKKAPRVREASHRVECLVPCARQLHRLRTVIRTVVDGEGTGRRAFYCRSKRYAYLAACIAPQYGRAGRRSNCERPRD